MRQNAVIFTPLVIVKMARLDYVRVRVKDVTGRTQRRWVRPDSLMKYQVTTYTPQKQPVYSTVQPVKYRGKKSYPMLGGIIPEPPKEEYPGQEVPEFVEVVVHVKIKYSSNNPHKNIQIDAYAGLTVSRSEYEANKEEIIKQLEDELMYQLRSAFGVKLINSVKSELEWGTPQLKEMDNPHTGFIRIDRRYFNGIWKTLVDYRGPGYDWFEDK